MKSPLTKVLVFAVAMSVGVGCKKKKSDDDDDDDDVATAPSGAGGGAGSSGTKVSITAYAPAEAGSGLRLQDSVPEIQVHLAGQEAPLALEGTPDFDSEGKATLLFTLPAGVNESYAVLSYEIDDVVKEAPFIIDTGVAADNTVVAVDDDTTAAGEIFAAIQANADAADNIVAMTIPLDDIAELGAVTQRGGEELTTEQTADLAVEVIAASDALVAEVGADVAREMSLLGGRAMSVAEVLNGDFDLLDWANAADDAQELALADRPEALALFDQFDVADASMQALVTAQPEAFADLAKDFIYWDEAYTLAEILGVDGPGAVDASLLLAMRADIENGDPAAILASTADLPFVAMVEDNVGSDGAYDADALIGLYADMDPDFFAQYNTVSADADAYLPEAPPSVQPPEEPSPSDPTNASTMTPAENCASFGGVWTVDAMSPMGGTCAFG